MIADPSPCPSGLKTDEEATAIANDTEFGLTS
jgi:hypothetical protein